MNRDLTTGKPSKVLWRFCLPLFGSVIFQQLYNLADSFVAGKFISENALAAVGNSYEITLIYIAFAFGCNIGCSVIVSKLFGAKEIGNMKTAVYTSAISTAVICAILMTLGLTLGTPLLRLINTPTALMADSLIYLNIYTLGLPFMFFYNISTGIFSALGDSKTPFIFLAASSTANIGADILFVTVFGMGVDGVAWATFICQSISCILAVIVVLIRLRSMKSTEKVRAFSFKMFKSIAGVAIPSTLQQSFISIGNIIIQGVINGFGPGVMAGYSAAIKLNNLVVTSFVTIGNGMSNYSAQNLGAGKPERIHMGFKAGIKMVIYIAIPFVAAYLLAGKYLVHFFLDSPSADAIKTGQQILNILAPFYVIISGKIVTDSLLRGAQKMTPFMISTFTDLVLRVVLAIILSKFMGALGIWCAWPIGWLVATAMSLIFYMRYHKRLKNGMI